MTRSRFPTYSRRTAEATRPSSVNRLSPRWSFLNGPPCGDSGRQFRKSIPFEWNQKCNYAAERERENDWSNSDWIDDFFSLRWLAASDLAFNGSMFPRHWKREEEKREREKEKEKEALNKHARRAGEQGIKRVVIAGPARISDRKTGFEKDRASTFYNWRVQTL